jgi:hypothetical protein
LQCRFGFMISPARAQFTTGADTGDKAGAPGPTFA